MLKFLTLTNIIHMYDLFLIFSYYVQILTIDSIQYKRLHVKINYAVVVGITLYSSEKISILHTSIINREKHFSKLSLIFFINRATIN